MSKFAQAVQGDGTVERALLQASSDRRGRADTDSARTRHAAAAIARDKDKCAQASGDFAPRPIDCVRSGGLVMRGASRGLSTRWGVDAGSMSRGRAPDGIGSVDMTDKRWQGMADPGGALRGARAPVMAGPSDRGPGDDDRSSTAIITRTKPKTKRPSLYRVLLLNDDYTPMEFVVHVVERFFNKSHEDAYQIMMHVHQNGVGECGIYTYEVAETKVTQVMDFARKHQHPLQCVMEKK